MYMQSYNLILVIKTLKNKETVMLSMQPERCLFL
jgi:hypothetical protein